MKSSVLAELAELDRLSLASLKRRWRELFGTDPPAYGRQLLRRRLAYRIQELAYGGLSEETKTRMEALVQGEQQPPRGDRPPPVKRLRKRPGSLPTGTRLVREFNGKRHEVIVGEGVFEFEGKRFRSLSAIARAITGTQWNGPAFFGLRGNMAKEVSR